MRLSIKVSCFIWTAYEIYTLFAEVVHWRIWGDVGRWRPRIFWRL